MPRTLRAVEGGGYYHVLNRGNGRRRIFHKPADYDAFLRVLAEALDRFPGVKLLAFCLMPNHWHLIVHPKSDQDLPAFMRWLMVTHVRRHHEAHGTRGGGHLYQGRYKSFPIRVDEHFLIACRYVEANAIRAGLVERARDWRWSSFLSRVSNGAPEWPEKVKLTPWPLDCPANWESLVQQKQREQEMVNLRVSIAKGRPFGGEGWMLRTARRLGLMQSLRAPGRPRKHRSQPERSKNQ